MWGQDRARDADSPVVAGVGRDEAGAGTVELRGLVETSLAPRWQVATGASSRALLLSPPAGARSIGEVLVTAWPHAQDGSRVPAC